ncbi:MAG: recombinase family protein [Candidatus Omnitrophica bacterium]|nr:recombinase family protein [Candidatus Omnitrophota bacterium]
MSKKVALYFRLRTRDLVMGTAPSNEVLDWLKEENISEQDVKLYEDRGSAEFNRRDGLENLKRDIVSGKIGTVVVRNLAQLFQRRDLFVKLMVLLQAAKVRLVCVEDDKIDTAIPMEEAVYKMTWYLDRADRETSAERARDKALFKGKRGRSPGSKDSVVRKKRTIWKKRKKSCRIS